MVIYILIIVINNHLDILIKLFIDLNSFKCINLFLLTAKMKLLFSIIL